MALTKVTGQVIKNTTDVTVGVLTVTNTLAVGGTVSIGGTLTYEDVTNVDSVGLITARNGIVVGSGITLSKDGDVFFTGIATGNGSGLTALNATQLTSGTVPTARLGSGTASSSTFLRGDSSFQTVNTDLVSDTTPQLGGNLDVNTKNILFGDSSGASDDRLTFGAGADLSIYHDGSNNYIDGNSAAEDHIYIRANVGSDQSSNIHLQAKAGEESIVCRDDEQVELYYDGALKLATNSDGVSFGDNVKLRLGDAPDYKIYHNGSHTYHENYTGDLYIKSDQMYLMSWTSGEQYLHAVKDGRVGLFYDNVIKLQTSGTDGVILANTTNDANYTNALTLTRRGYETSGYGVRIQAKGGSAASQNGLRFVISDGGGSNYTSRFSFTNDGLLFNSDTAAANALDDYEEGSHTPDFANADNSIVTVNHYTYTKVGRLVHFEAKFTVGSNNDGSGFGFTLPVAQAGSRETVIPAISTRSSPNNPFSFVVNANQSYAYAKALQGYSTSAVEYVDFAGSIILVSGTYEAA